MQKWGERKWRACSKEEGGERKSSLGFLYQFFPFELNGGLTQKGLCHLLLLELGKY